MSRAVRAIDVLVVSGANTGGWRVAAAELADSIARAGAGVETVTAEPSPTVRTFALTDAVQALHARRAAQAGISAHHPRAVIYCSISSALLWPQPGAIFLDSIAAENRPGRHGIWQRPVERRRLSAAPLVLAMSERSLDPLPAPHPDTVVVPIPVHASPGPSGPRDLAAVAYAADPVKRRLDWLLASWTRARRSGETLAVAGLDPRLVPEAEGVCAVGRLAAAEFRALLRRARVYLAAPRREDYGITALEALSDGCQVVTAPSPGPYPALGLARELDPRLVTDDLAGALRTALDNPRPDYAEAASRLLAPFRPAAVDRLIAERVLPRLIGR